MSLKREEGVELLLPAASYLRDRLQLLPLPLNDLVIIFILFEFLLASVQQHLTEIHIVSRFVQSVDSKLKRQEGALEERTEGTQDQTLHQKMKLK